MGKDATRLPEDLLWAGRLGEGRDKILGQLGKIIIGQEQAIEELLIALFARGHALLVGVPGLAKTLLISSLARILDFEFKRIQFTPDLMPSDITGSEILQEDPVTRQRVFKFAPGPVFGNMILADEINRTPPKTQAALLQAMQERQVTVAGQTRALPLPFFVLATQNPIEQEGTYPLPEAQLDRFFLQINIGYPTLAEETRIVGETTGAQVVTLEKALGAQDVLSLQEVVRRVPISDSAVQLAVRLARLSRPAEAGAPDFVKRWLSWGAGPRASQALVLGAKARALLNGRSAVAEEDILRIAGPVLRHRLVLNFQAEADGVKVDDIVLELVRAVRA